MKVCIVGGGISGLCAAYRLKNAGVDVTLYEAGGRVGGNIRTETRDGFLFEHGPNSLLPNHEVLNLIRDLGLDGEIAAPGPSAKKRYILRDGRLAALPHKKRHIFGNEAFSRKGILRMLMEPLVRSASPDGESVSAFSARRLGKEIAVYGVDPFISGIYAGDPHKLSIKNAFPKLYEFEQKHGSLIKGALASRKDKSARLPKGTPRSFTFRAGVQTLTDALQARLGDSVRLDTRVTAVRKADRDGYAVATDAGEEIFDAVVVSTPARAAARLLEEFEASPSREIADIYYPPVSVVISAYRRERVGIEPDGFGLLLPKVEQRRILGCLWTSTIFENRAPHGFHLFTTFIGGSRNAELCEKPEEDLLGIAAEELAAIMKIDGPPEFSSVIKWERAIPQYNIGYENVPAAIERFRKEHPGIFFCSNFYKGISVGDCVKNGAAAAEEILEFLKGSSAIQA